MNDGKYKCCTDLLCGVVDLQIWEVYKSVPASATLARLHASSTSTHATSLGLKRLWVVRMFEVGENTQTGHQA